MERIIYGINKLLELDDLDLKEYFKTNYKQPNISPISVRIALREIKEMIKEEFALG